MPDLFHPPVKRSVEIAGHKTSISLEPLFWDWLRAAAVEQGVPINALVARIDAERIKAATPPGLAGAIRLWLAARALPAGDYSPPVRSTSAPSSTSFSSSRS